MFRKVALVLVAPLLAATACAGEADQAAVEVKTGAAAVSALRAAPDAVADVGTVAIEMVMEMTTEGEGAEMRATGAMDSAARRMEMEIDMGAMLRDLASATGETVPEGFDEPWQMVGDGDTLYLRAPLFDVLGGDGRWLSLSAADMGGAGSFGTEAFDVRQTLESLRGVVGEPEVVGSEAVRGVDTTRYSATLDLREALAEAPEEQRAALEAQLDQLGDAEIPVEVWIDADDLPRRLRMDMGSLFAAAGLGDGAMSMTMEWFDYGEPVDIEVPPADEVTPFSEVMGGLGGALGS